MPVFPNFQMYFRFEHWQQQQRSTLFFLITWEYYEQVRTVYGAPERYKTKGTHHVIGRLSCWSSEDNMDIKIIHVSWGRSLAPVLHASRLHGNAYTYAYHSVA